MKKLLVAFIVLVVAFLLIWAVKLKEPLNSTFTGDELSDTAPWWEKIAEGETPTADEAWILDPEIPENYIPVLNADELYMVIDDDGNIIQYRHRYQFEDGTWMWEDVDPNIPENYEAVEGLENVYRVVGADGSVRYYQYTRNSDDTYFFTEVDEYGNPLNNDPSGSEIPPNYIRVTGNIYAVYNEYGVLTGYKERYVDENGSYAWRDCDEPIIGESNSPIAGGTQGNTGGSGTGGDIYIISGDKNDPSATEGYVETETITDTVHDEDGWTVVYETTVTRTYDRSGNLVSTKKDGPTEVNRFPTTNINTDILPASDRIESSLNNEKTRITNGLTYNTALESEVFALLNAQRAKNDLAPLTLATGDLDSLAQIKAADMAVNGTTGANSSLYGTVLELCSHFGIEGTVLAESEWRTSDTKSASNIHSRFQSNTISFNNRMSNGISSVAIAIVKGNGYYYICELYA